MNFPKTSLFLVVATTYQDALEHMQAVERRSWRYAVDETSVFDSRHIRVIICPNSDAPTGERAEELTRLHDRLAQMRRSGEGDIVFGDLVGRRFMPWSESLDD